MSYEEDISKRASDVVIQPTTRGYEVYRADGTLEHTYEDEDTAIARAEKLADRAGVDVAKRHIIYN